MKNKTEKPKEEPKKEDKQPGEPSQIADLIEIVSRLSQQVTELQKKFETPAQKREITLTPEVTTTTEVKDPQTPPANIDSSYPVPTEYRAVVDSILNKKFKIEFSFLPSAGAFEFAILVPKEYSNATAGHWAMYHEDRRTKVIEMSLGVNAVQEWTQRVHDQLPQETRSLIAMDRAKMD